MAVLAKKTWIKTHHIFEASLSGINCLIVSQSGINKCPDSSYAQKTIRNVRIKQALLWITYFRI